MKEEVSSEGEHEDADDSPKGNNRKARTFTKIKDLNKPKMPHTAYIMFLSDRRKAIRREGQNVKNTELNVMLANEWKLLPEDQKAAYHQRAQEARAAYEKDILEYQKTETYHEFVQKRAAILKERRMYRRSGMDGAEAEKAARRAIEGGSALNSEGGPSSTKKGSTKKTTARGKNININDAGKNVSTNDSIPIFSREFLDYNKEKETALRNLRKKSGVAEEEQRLLRDVIGKLETNCAHVKEQLNEEERATVDWQKLVERWTRVASEALAKAKLPHAGGLKGEALLARLQKAVNGGTDPELLKEARAALQNVNFN